MLNSAEGGLAADISSQNTAQTNDPASYCIEAIQRILGNRAWHDALEDYLPFPVSFWSNRETSGKGLLGLYEAPGDSEQADEGTDGDESNAGPGKLTANRKRSLARASTNERNVRRRVAKAAKRAAQADAALENQAEGEEGEQDGGEVGGTDQDEEDEGEGPLASTSAAPANVNRTLVLSPIRRKAGPPKGTSLKLAMRFWFERLACYLQSVFIRFEL